MKKRNIIIICGIVVLLLLVTGVFVVSYGYITSDIVNKDGNGKYFIVENLRIEYSDGTEELTTNQEDVFIPGSILTKTFTVKNTGNSDVNYNILFTNIENTFNRKNDIVYELYLDETLLASGIFPDKETSYIVGDINLDGIINEEDYNKLKAFTEGKTTLTRLEMTAADLNLDNTIDELDSPTLIKEYIDNLNVENENESIDIENEDNTTSTTSNIGKIKVTENLETILDNQSLLVDETKTYTLKIKYLTSEENQIEDSGKTINGKIYFEQSN